MAQSVVFSILMLLLARRKVSRDFLAERFGVCKRTISRYLSILEDAGVPLVSVPGRNGGVALADDYMLDTTVLSEAETNRIKAVLENTAVNYDDNVNRTLVEKLDSINKCREHNDYIIKQDELYIDCDYAQSSTIRPRMKSLSAAIEQRRAVDIKYTDARGYISYRTIEPYTIVFKAGAWYIYAMCKLRGDFRLFKISRISDIRITSKRFIRYESKLTEKLELEFYNEVYIDLEMEVFPTVAESIVDWLGVSAITERGTKIVATAEVPYTDSLVKRLLSYGSSVKVLNPTELAEQLRDEAKRMLDLYGD